MRIYRKILLLVVNVLVINTFAQQLPLLDHYYINPYLSNPARVGNDGNNVFLINRSQWLDVQGAPETFLLTMDGSIPDKNVGLGFMIYNDVVNILGKTGAMGTYSYKLPFSQGNKLSFGLSLGVEQNRLMFDRIESENPVEITLINNLKQDVKFDANFGINYGNDKLNVGLAAYQLFANKDIFTDDENFNSYKFSFVRHFLATASYDFTVKQDELFLIPTTQFRIAKDATPQLDLNLMLNVKRKVWAGVGYRTAFGMNFNVGAFMAEKLQVGYSYGRSLGDITRLSANSHEILLGMKLGKSSTLDIDKDGVPDLTDLEPKTPHWEHVHAAEPFLDASQCKVNKQGITLDSDFDKVPDCVDLEVNSPIGAAVDENGVALDTDKDGVPDIFDREENTIENCQVDKFGVALDGDKDGVPNCIDDQLDSPFGSPVDEQGVALDADKDGVPDMYDFEPETAENCKVDSRGISIDTDKDGVPDCRDREINSPLRAIVDKNGVALDGDRDGIPDGLDVEPDSPEGCVVDKWGRCGNNPNAPVDSDGDGVPDAVDRQPNTPRGAKVDEWGVAKSDSPASKVDLKDMKDNDPDHNYYIIVGVFKNPQYAARYRDHLVKHYGQSTNIRRAKNEAGDEEYLYIYTKQVYTRDEALTEVNRLQSEDIEDYIVGNVWIRKELKN